ncbi:integrin subunit alpha 8, partial [Mortierella antarctica]
RIAAFLFGIVAHSLSDLSWHSLRGLQAGFIRVQAAAGHMQALDHLISDWQVPVKDVLEIYRRRNITIPTSELVQCLVKGYAGSQAKARLDPPLFDTFARQSPFVTEQIENYPMGGFYDMTMWMLECWNGLAGYLNKDPAVNLTSPETPFHLCDELMEGKTSKPTEVPQFSSDSQVEKEKSHAHTGIASGHQSVNENLQRRGEEILQPGMDDLNKAGLTVQTNTDPATGMVAFSIQELQNHDNPTATVTPGVEPMVARRRSDVLTNKVNTICEHFMDDAERTGCLGVDAFWGCRGRWCG